MALSCVLLRAAQASYDVVVLKDEMSIQIRRVYDLQLALFQSLIDESVAAGFRHLARLRDEWIAGENRFDQEGEVLFAAESNRKIIGVCGLNRNPYDTASRVGRVRRLYVADSFRRQGVGKALVLNVVAAARPHFTALEVRTHSQEADAFYRALGFTAVLVKHATHRIELHSE